MLRRLPLAAVKPNCDQPRKDFDPGQLRELASSIKAEGLMQPITVRPLGNGTYEIVAGERRWRAHKLLAEKGELPEGTILCQIKSMDDEKRDVQAIIENMARADISPLEEANAFARMLDKGWTAERLAAALGTTEYRVHERVALTKLDDQLRTLVARGQLAPTAGYEIAKLPKHEQLTIAKAINRGQIKTLAEIRAAVSAVETKLSQADIFGSAEPDARRVTDAEVQLVQGMERKIDSVIAAVSGGWKDGACVVATKVSPDRARLMAEKLKGLQLTLSRMERELRVAATQFEMAMEAA